MDYGRDRAVRLVLEGKGIRTAERLTWLSHPEKAAIGVRGVFGVAGRFTRYERDVRAWSPDHPEKPILFDFRRLSAEISRGSRLPLCRSCTVSDRERLLFSVVGRAAPFPRVAFAERISR